MQIELLINRLLTRAICQIVLLALYSILQVLGFSSSLLDARLHRLRRYIVRHCVVVMKQWIECSAGGGCKLGVEMMARGLRQTEDSSPRLLMAQLSPKTLFGSVALNGLIGEVEFRWFSIG